MKRTFLLPFRLLCFLSILFASTLCVAAEDPSVTHEQKAQPETWREPLTGMELIRIPAGCFSMGSPPSEEGRQSDEGPVHRVCVDEFWMGKFEVSRGQFKAFIEAAGYKTDADKEGFAWAYNGEWVKKSDNNWARTSFDQEDDHPVVNVSWNDAQAMAGWLSEKSKGRFRLPTEAEWEYACRAQTRTARFWGNDPDQACSQANVADLTAREQFLGWTTHNCRDDAVYTAAVGHYEPNGFGLYDMLGNASEWCLDVYGKEAYAGHSEKNPGHASGDWSRVIRGGSWFSRPEIARCAARDHLQTPTRRSHDLGFRLVRFE